MDSQTAKSIDRSLKVIAESLRKIENNTRPKNEIDESTYRNQTNPNDVQFNIHFSAIRSEEGIHEVAKEIEKELLDRLSSLSR